LFTRMPYHSYRQDSRSQNILRIRSSYVLQCWAEGISTLHRTLLFHNVLVKQHTSQKRRLLIAAPTSDLCFTSVIEHHHSGRPPFLRETRLEKGG
jgi:hypothetical protein